MAFNDVGSFEVLDAGLYRVKVERIEDADGQFGPQNKWVFLVSQNGTQKFQSDGRTPYEMWAFTSMATGAGSKAGEYFEALLDRQLMMGESGAKLAMEVIGKQADAMIGLGNPDKNGNQRNKILQMMPIKRQAPKTSTPEPEAPPTPPAEPVDGFVSAGEAEQNIPFDRPQPDPGDAMKAEYQAMTTDTKRIELQDSLAALLRRADFLGIDQAGYVAGGGESTGEMEGLISRLRAKIAETENLSPSLPL